MCHYIPSERLKLFCFKMLNVHVTQALAYFELASEEIRSSLECFPSLVCRLQIADYNNKKSMTD